MRILLAEDEPQLCQQIKRLLIAEGRIVDIVNDGVEAHFMGATEPYDMIIMDIGLPKRDGISVLREWRKDGITTPVLILTARDGWSERVDGLDAGADDYMTKPYSLAELMARVQAQLRRSRPAAAGARLEFEDIVLDGETHRVTRGGAEIKLGPTEFRLLSTFMEKPGRVLSREQLLDRVWGRDIHVDSRTVDVHVGRLRKALGQGGASDLLRTVRGAGYALG